MMFGTLFNWMRCTGTNDVFRRIVDLACEVGERHPGVGICLPICTTSVEVEIPP